MIGPCRWKTSSSGAERTTTWRSARASSTPGCPTEEFQADLFFFDDLKQRKKEPAKYNAGLLVADTFNKKIAVVPIEGKQAGHLGGALEKAFKQMGGKPEMIYWDAEPGLTSNKTQAWLKRQNNIARNIAFRHAPVAERMIG